MLLSAVSVLVVAQSSSEIPEGLMNNPVFSNLQRLWIIELFLYLTVMSRLCSLLTAFSMLQSAYCNLHNHRTDRCWKFSFLQNFQTGCGTRPVFHPVDSRGFPSRGQQENKRSRRLAAQLYLLLSLRMSGRTNWRLLVTYKIGTWNVDNLEITSCCWGSYVRHIIAIFRAHCQGRQ